MIFRVIRNLLVEGVASLGATVGHLHLLSIAVVSSDVEDVALLLAALVNLLDGLVAGSNGGNGSVVLCGSQSKASRSPHNTSTYDASVANVAWMLANEQDMRGEITYHIGGSEVLPSLSAELSNVRDS